MNGINKISVVGADQCVCCGSYVPEGRYVCYSCEHKKPIIFSESQTLLAALRIKKRRHIGHSQFRDKRQTEKMQS